jgi:hypothetical protein
VKSIIQGDDEYCFLCKKRDVYLYGTEVHHMIFGVAKRKLADQDGLTVHLCNYHHVMLHRHGDYKEELQQLAEKTWLEHYNKSVEDFIQRYGKNYL